VIISSNDISGRWRVDFSKTPDIAFDQIISLVTISWAAKNTLPMLIAITKVRIRAQVI
jgi:hypothetical protein